MPRDFIVTITVNGTPYGFIVHVLESAQSHGRSDQSTNQVLMANAHAIRSLVNDEDNRGTGTITTADGRKMHFRKPGTGQVCHTVLYHVDLTKNERSSQMQSRSLGGPGKGGGVGGGYNPGSTMKGLG